MTNEALSERARRPTARLACDAEYEDSVVDLLYLFVAVRWLQSTEFAETTRRTPSAQGRPLPPDLLTDTAILPKNSPGATIATESSHPKVCTDIDRRVLSAVDRQRVRDEASAWRSEPVGVLTLPASPKYCVSSIPTRIPIESRSIVEGSQTLLTSHERRSSIKFSISTRLPEQPCRIPFRLPDWNAPSNNRQRIRLKPTQKSVACCNDAPSSFLPRISSNRKRIFATARAKIGQCWFWRRFGYLDVKDRRATVHESAYTNERPFLRHPDRVATITDYLPFSLTFRKGQIEANIGDF